MSESIDGKYIPIAQRRKVRYEHRSKKVWPKADANMKLQFVAVSQPTPMGEKNLKLFLKFFHVFLPHRYRHPRVKKHATQKTA